MPRRHDLVPLSTRAKTKAPHPNPAVASPLQLEVANRVRLTLSLLDQRADGGPGFRLTHPMVIAGVNPYLPTPMSTNWSNSSRLLRGHRGLTFDFIFALTRWAGDVFGLAVDPGWLAFGRDSEAAPPEIPIDCVVREDTSLDGLERSSRTLRIVRGEERRPRRKAAG